MTRGDLYAVLATILLSGMVLALALRSRPIVVRVEIPRESQITIRHNLVLPVKAKEGSEP